MITKAGVPIQKLMLDQPLYGRSTLKMTQAGCWSAMCTYTGPDSGAIPGKCSDTAGYISNWEVRCDARTNASARSKRLPSSRLTKSSITVLEQYYSKVAGNILVCDSTQWISWMDPSTYNARSSWAASLGFGGSSDWAIDLNASYAQNGTELGLGSGVVTISPEIFTSSAPTIACSPPCTFVFPPWTLSTPTTISQPATTMTVEEV